MKIEETVNQIGWFAKIKEQFNLATITEKINQYKDIIIEVALYSGLGFLIGFLLKKYSSYVAVFVLFILTLIALYQLDVMVFVINWPKVYELLGIQPAVIADENLLTIVWEFMKANLTITVSLIIGFFIGFKFA